MRPIRTSRVTRRSRDWTERAAPLREYFRNHQSHRALVPVDPEVNAKAKPERGSVDSTEEG